MMFAHGFGCDQNMWRLVVPAFEDSHRVVLFDHVGAGQSDASAYDRKKYSTLEGYATDVLEICHELQIRDVVFVGHSVSAMIGVLAAKQAPKLFRALILVGPSPRYIDDADYVGGFSRQDIEGLLSSLDSNYLGWSSSMAPVIMGNPDRPELGAELTTASAAPIPRLRHTSRASPSFPTTGRISDKSVRPRSFCSAPTTSLLPSRLASTSTATSRRVSWW